MKNNYENIVNELREIKYELISEKCEKTVDKIYVRCPNGHIWNTTLSKIRSGRRCPYCSGKFIHILEVKKILESENYKLLSDTVSRMSQKIKVECPNGHIYETTFNNFKIGRRCAICKSSKGEKRIAEVLNKFNIKFYQQHSFDDCIYKQKLRFDFYIPDKKTIIEYDGRFHYLQLANSQELFENIQIRDNIKTLYCRNNGLTILRIPYWEYDNIENILIGKLELNTNNINFND